MATKDAKTPAAPALSFSEILADMDSADHDPIALSELPPLTAAEEIRRTPRRLPIPDMTTFVKLWQLIGEGNTGKTVLARWLIEKLIAHDKLGQSVIAALAPGNRNLTEFAKGTMQPPSSDATATANWATKRLLAMQKARWGGVWDFGGGDTSQRMMIQAQPTMADTAEQDGLAIVAAHLFSPRLDDLAFLKTYERMGFRPRATALILNLGKAASPSAFNDMRRQPEYRAALDRGAVEIWMPALPQNVALAIEKARVLFCQARDGEAPEGKREAAIALIERVMVREWLEAMDAEFGAIESKGWMPWT
jgi:hypothetical protein